MKPLITATLLAALTFGGVAPAFASELLETYFARLGEDDHFNSKGERLTSVAAIIRQDRANFHRFGIRDPDDESDSFFSRANNRARLEKMINRGNISKSARRAILNSTPIIYVEIYDDFINVQVQ
jgi:hypothetical protein